MALQTIFTAAQLAAIAADQGASNTIPSAGQQGFHITNQSGAFVSVTDNFGSVIARIGPWLDMTGQIQLATTQLTFTVSPVDPVQQIAGVGSGTWNVLCELLIDPQPIATTMLASALAGPIVPANSAISALVRNSSAIVRIPYGAAFNRPTKIFTFSGIVYQQISAQAAGQGIVVDGLAGLVGQTSGIYIDLITWSFEVNNETAAAGGFYGTDRWNEVYPFPLNLSLLLPNDAQVKYQAGYIGTAVNIDAMSMLAA